MKTEPFYKGSVKNLYRRVHGTVDFEFTDGFSVFDIGRHHQEIPGKGVALCDMAEQSFRIAHSRGIKTHFIDRLDESTLRVKEFSMPEGELDSNSADYVVPLEWITRERVAGSILRDFQEGTKDWHGYGISLDHAPKLGHPFPFPVHQITTKREDVDREISQEEACRMAGITEEDADQIWRIIDRLDDAISMVAGTVDFLHFDGKKEVALDEHRQAVIVDTFGTMDEDRFCPADTFENGVVEDFSKEYIRRIFIDNGFYKAVKQARQEGKPIPPYPDLTGAQIEECARRYWFFAKQYSGAVIR